MNPRMEGQEWLVLINQGNSSRMSSGEVRARVQAGKLAPDTLVWRGGMSDWASISSIAELATQNPLPTPPRGPQRSGYNPRFAETVISSHRAAQQYQRRPTPSSGGLVLVLATGAAVLLTVLATSYALYTAGAFQAGGERSGTDVQSGSRAAE